MHVPTAHIDPSPLPPPISPENQKDWGTLHYVADEGHLTDLHEHQPRNSITLSAKISHNAEVGPKTGTLNDKAQGKVSDMLPRGTYTTPCSSLPWTF